MKIFLLHLPHRAKVQWLVLSLLLLGLLPVSGLALRAQSFPFVIWVYDADVRDSQFGYFDGTVSRAVGEIYPDLDSEGLSCRNGVIYATSGGDGRVPSRLFTLQLDVANDRAQLDEIATLRTPAGDPLYEVSALSTASDQSLWGFAADREPTGLVQIDTATAVATLIKPSQLDVAAIAWLGETLWLGAGTQLYTWTPGAEITPAFKVTGIRQIETLDVINNLLYLAGDNVTEVIVIDPANGQRVDAPTFPIPDDIEGFTFCPDFQPPATATPTLTPTLPPTPTSTSTATSTPIATPTATAMATPTTTPSPSVTTTPAATATVTATDVADATLTVTGTSTPSATATPTAATPTPTATATPPPPAVVTPTSSAPTALEVAAFRSAIQADGLALYWETSVEVDTVGFYLWRSSTPDRSQAQLLNEGMISAEGNRGTGASYRWQDPTVESGRSYTYWLEAMRADGTVNETVSISLTFARPLYLPYLRR